MKRVIVHGRFVVMLSLFLLITGCATYYKVTEPQSGKVYYTEGIDNLKGGAVKLKDARTGSVVTIQNSEVKEISSQEYKEGLTAPASMPAPAAAPTPAPAPIQSPANEPSHAPAAQPSSAPSGT